MTAVDTIRGYAAALEAVANVAAATLAPLGFVTKATYKDDLKTQIPEYKRNTVDQEGDPIPTTYTASGTIEGEVDNQGEHGLFLASAQGMPTVSGNTKTFAVLNTPATLTMIFLFGLSNVYRQVTGMRISNLKYVITPANTLKYTANWVGIPEEPLTSPPTLVYTGLPTGSAALRADQAVLSRGGTAYCMDNFTYELQRDANPKYCTPVVAPTGSSPAGAKPSRFKNGKWRGRVEMRYAYDADSGSSQYNYRHSTAEVWDALITDPQTQAAASLAYLPTLHFIIPRAGLTEVDLDWEDEEVGQVAKGIISRDATNGRGTVVMINGRSYTAS